MGSVLDRPLIRNEFTAKYVEIIVELEKEIVICEVSFKLNKIRAAKIFWLSSQKRITWRFPLQDLFNEQSNRFYKYGFMEVDTFFPPVAGGLLYMTMLATRITKPVASFRNLPHP